MNVYRTNPMRTRPSFAKFLSIVPAALILLGSSTMAVADHKVEPAKKQTAAEKPCSNNHRHNQAPDEASSGTPAVPVRATAKVEC
jgi:hypothetical protein